MNFSYSKSFRNNFFRKNIFNNKNSFNIFKSSVNTFRFTTMFNNKFYLTNINFLNACKNMQSNLESSRYLAGSSATSTEAPCEDINSCAISEKCKFK